jgi:hypothetical protein
MDAWLGPLLHGDKDSRSVADRAAAKALGWARLSSPGSSCGAIRTTGPTTPSRLASGRRRARRSTRVGACGSRPTRCCRPTRPRSSGGPMSRPGSFCRWTCARTPGRPRAAAVAGRHRRRRRGRPSPESAGRSADACQGPSPCRWTAGRGVGLRRPFRPARARRHGLGAAGLGALAAEIKPHRRTTLASFALFVGVGRIPGWTQLPPDRSTAVRTKSHPGRGLANRFGSRDHDQADQRG